jgi:hypothetical protein
VAALLEAAVPVSCGDRAQLEAAWQVLGPLGRVGTAAAPEVAAAAAVPGERHRRVLRDLAAVQRACATPPERQGLPPPGGSADAGSGGGGGGGGADALWAAGGLLDGACPAPHILRWLPPPALAFPDCGPALARHCAALAADNDHAPGSSHNARHAPVAAADCAAGKWLGPRDAALAQRAQAAAAAQGLCPAGGATSMRGGASGVLWVTQDRPLPRSALSSRFCELPLA